MEGKRPIDPDSRRRSRRERILRSRSPKARLWRYALAVGLLLILILGWLVEEISEEITPDSRFAVARVIDGDTVELVGGDRLRLLYIDSPEKGQPYYDSAMILLDSLTRGKLPRLRFGRRQRDVYGRLLAALEVSGLSVNLELVRRGFAHIYLFPDNLKDTANSEQGIILRALLEAQRAALSERVGVWSVSRAPETQYRTTLKSLRFHRPDCRSVANRSEGNLRLFSLREDALYEGLSPCRNCRP